jgi:YHS domain-containing protein
MESNASGTIAHDPVCGMDVEIASAQNKTEYQGQTYYFCSRGCMLDFQDDPEKYLDPSYAPTGMDGH